MSLLSLDIAEIKSVVSDIIRDDVISTSIILKMLNSGTTSWNPTSGTIPTMYTESGVSSFKTTYSLDEIERLNTERGIGVPSRMIQQGDIKFILLTSDVTGILNVDGLIVESATTYQSLTTYQIMSIERDPINCCYFLQCRSV